MLLRKEASGLRLFVGLLWDQVAGGSNPLNPTIRTGENGLDRKVILIGKAIVDKI